MFNSAVAMTAGGVAVMLTKKGTRFRSTCLKFVLHMSYNEFEMTINYTESMTPTFRFVGIMYKEKEILLNGELVDSFHSVEFCYPLWIVFSAQVFFLFIYIYIYIYIFKRKKVLRYFH